MLLLSFLLSRWAKENNMTTMVYNQYKCDNEVKEYFKDHHINCTTNKSSKKTPKTVTGSYLNRFIYFRPFKTNKSIRYAIISIISSSKSNFDLLVMMRGKHVTTQQWTTL